MESRTPNSTAHTCRVPIDVSVCRKQQKDPLYRNLRPEGKNAGFVRNKLRTQFSMIRSSHHDLPGGYNPNRDHTDLYPTKIMRLSQYSLPNECSPSRSITN
ncbi:hypothetical protein NDU88_003616 [Pleurodeles waltl]|uniref:Uncharacterized protein n=1 Tax=Pleurodeles waltl TaxID=8319 RepID=A0AAV7PIP1_PLEWA|nr:hypothetical protein NDU88_003616 [Pleurodeles waltl]